VRFSHILLRVKHNRGGEHHQNREAKCDLCVSTRCHLLRSGHAGKKTQTDLDNLAQFVSRRYAGLEEDLHTRRISHVRDVPYGRDRVETVSVTGQLYLQALVLSSYFEDT
jgi:hypothetical protein